VGHSHSPLSMPLPLLCGCVVSVCGPKVCHVGYQCHRNGAPNEALNLTAQLCACQALIKFTVLLVHQLGVKYGPTNLAPTRLPFQWSVGVAMVVVEGREEAMLALK